MRSRLIPATALLALAACQHAPDGAPYMGGPDNFGEANRQTMAAQIIDPAPQYDTLVPETSGHKAAEAIDRYRNDTVKQPEGQKTTNVGSGGGGGSGGDE